MNIGERMVRVETKLTTIERMLWLIIVGLGTKVGIDFIPLASAFLA